MNCAEYRQQFLDIIRTKSIQQTPPHLLHSQSSKPSPLGDSPNKSESSKSVVQSSHKQCKSIALSSSTDRREKVRPPLKIKKLTQPKANNIHKNSQTTAISKSQLSSNSNRSTQSQNSRTLACHPDCVVMPLNDLTKHVECMPAKRSKSVQITPPCTLNATCSNGEHETRCTFHVNTVVHSTVKISNLECPTGSSLSQDMHLFTHNPSPTNENDEHKSKCTPNEQSISPPCTSKSKAKNPILKWNELHSSLQYVLPPDDDYSYVVEIGPPIKKKKIPSTVSTPMILAICTPIMKRTHQYVQQSRDVVFIDATSSFDRQNTSICLLSTVTPGGAVPLGVIVTSDEQEETITEGKEPNIYLTR